MGGLLTMAVRFGGGVLAFCVAGAVQAQAYPTKPVRIVVGFAAGGSVDIVARILAQRLGESFGQPFLVENRVGAAGNIGADHVAKSAPDGYTILLSSATALASGISIYRKLPFDPRTDFAPVILVAHQPSVLVVHPSVPAQTVKELVALAKGRPGRLNYGTSGLGGVHHMRGEMFMLLTGVRFEAVPYKGGGPALNDLIGGQIDVMLDTVPTVIEFVRNGRLRALAVTSAQRVGALPTVPTLAQAGVPGYDLKSWHGLAVPAGTPRQIVQRLNGEAHKAITGELKARFAEMGLDAAGGTPEEFAAFIREEIVRYARLVKASGMPLQ
jgi:tripartite-type tricarboxylate transporter receptor subunit TctC